jgi:hypothetical protein
MAYVSHTVRSLRRDPIPDETVRLVLTVDDASTEVSSADSGPDETESVAEAVESLDGEVVRELEFGRLLVEVEQSDLDAVCELDGVSAVETDAVLDQHS